MSISLVEKLESSPEIDEKYKNCLGEINNQEDINKYYKDKFDTILSNSKKLEDPTYVPKSQNTIFSIAHKIIHNIDLTDICFSGGALAMSIAKGEDYIDEINLQDVDLFYFGKNELCVGRFKQLASDLSKIFKIVYYIKYCNIINIYISVLDKIYVIQLIDKFKISMMTPRDNIRLLEYNSALNIVNSFDIECLKTYIENKKIKVPIDAFDYVKYGCFESSKFLDEDINIRKSHNNHKDDNILNDVYLMNRFNKYLYRGFNFYLSIKYQIYRENSETSLLVEVETDFTQKLTNIYKLYDGKSYKSNILLLDYQPKDEKFDSELMMLKEHIIKFLAKKFIGNDNTAHNTLTNIMDDNSEIALYVKKAFEEEIEISEKIKKKYLNFTHGYEFSSMIYKKMPKEIYEEIKKLNLFDDASTSTNTAPTNTTPQIKGDDEQLFDHPCGGYN